MNIGLDVDGVLAEQTNAYLPYLNKFYNLNGKKEDIVEWYYWKRYGVGTEQLLNCMALAWHKFYEIQLEETKIPEMIHDLHKKHKIIIVSHRTRSTFPFVCQWLDLHKIEYDALVFLTSRDSKTNYPIDCLIDDSPEAVKEFTSSNKHLYLRTQPWNRNIVDLPSNVTRVDNFAEFYYKILSQ